MKRLFVCLWISGAMMAGAQEPVVHDPSVLFLYETRLQARALLNEDPAESVLLLTGLIAGYPPTPDLHVDRSIAWRHLGEFEKAMMDLESALALSFNHFEALANRGLLHRQAGRLQQALEDFRLLDRYAPLNPEGLYQQALTYDQMQMRDRALETYNRVLRRFPGHAPSLNNRAAIHMGANQWDEAMKDLEQALLFDPALPEIHINRARLLHYRGRLRASLEACELADSLRPEWVELRRLRAEVYYGLDEYEKALDDLDFVLSRQPEDYQATEARQKTLQALGR